MTAKQANCRRDPARKLDGRTREARLMAQVRADLTRHVGGEPSATERVMIERAVALSLRLALLDAKLVDGRDLTEHDSRTYLAWSNSLSRTMGALGMKGAAQRTQSLADAMRLQRA